MGAPSAWVPVDDSWVPYTEGSGLFGPQGGGIWTSGSQVGNTGPLDLRSEGARTAGSSKGHGLGLGSRVFICLHSAGPIQLWQFLLELLRDGERSNCIRWTGNSREFQLCDPREVGEPPRRAASRPDLLGFNLAGPFCLPLTWPRPQLVLLSTPPEVTGTNSRPERTRNRAPRPARPLPSPAPSCLSD